jgi:uracil-DNA glycosylase family 4
MLCKPFKPETDTLYKMRFNACETCPLKDPSKPTPQVFGEIGDTTALRLVLVGEAPGAEEADRGRPFIGRSGTYLRSILSSIGVASSQILVTNIVKCRPPDNRDPTAAECATCGEFLDWELRQLGGRYPIVALGKVAANFLLDNRNAIGKLRGVRFDTEYGPVIPTYHPAAALRNPNLAREIHDDIVLALKSFSENNLPVPELVLGKPALQALKSYLCDTSRPTLVLDIETHGGFGKGGLSPLRDDSKITVLGCKIPGGNTTYHFTSRKDMLVCGRLIGAAAEKVRIVGHNLKFDLRWLLTFGILTPKEVMAMTYWDTMVNYALLDEEISSKGLKRLCMGVFNVPSWEVDFEKVSMPDLIRYNGVDLIMTERLSMHEAKAGVSWRLTERGTPVVALLEYYGINVSINQVQEMEKAYRTKVEKALLVLKEKVDNPRSTKQVAKLLFEDMKLPVYKRTEKNKAPSTDEEAMSTLLEHKIPADAREFITNLLEYKKLDKVLGTYILPIYDYLSGQVKREVRTLHPSYKLTRSEFSGTVTGRLASSGPNLQNQPPDILAVFESRFEGGVLQYVDLGQIELRVLAQESACEHLCNIYTRGLDLHGQVADEVVAPRKTGTDKKTLRTIAKRVNFGIAYLIGGKGLTRQLPDLTVEEAEAFIEAWYRRFPGVAKWQEATKDHIISHGFVQNIFGRSRHLHGANRYSGVGRRMLRQGVNFPIQSGASDLMVYGIMPAVTRDLLKEDLGSVVVGNIHDAIIIDTHPDEKEAVDGIIKVNFSDPELPACGTLMNPGARRWSNISSIPIEYDVTEIGAGKGVAEDE